MKGDRHYDHREVETRWQERWEADGLWRLDVDSAQAPESFYNLVEFPYPSAEGLHVGHAYTYSGADTFGRYQRMRGRDVFQPIGFDSFGIHTENYALRAGRHPAELTAETVAHYRGQLRRLGAAWDWSREVVTSDPAYYRWTQWIFLRLYRAGLAERREAPVVWCPSCLTVLAFEQLEGDRCERCGTPVTDRVMRQWFLRITVYADRLLAGLDGLDWPQSAKRLQREWIGRSEGVEIDFPVPEAGLTLSAFTTRPETLFGATFVAVPPGHPDLDRLAAPERRAAVRAFSEEALARRVAGERRGEGGRDIEGAGEQTRRGIDTGRHALHPVTGHPIPILVADHVVAGYGTGAVMGVPAHDRRDFAFAEALDLPVVAVVDAPTGHGLPWTGDGTMVGPTPVPFDGLPSDEARRRMPSWVEERVIGRASVRFHLRDWLISRQRYWGPPIPIVHCPACGEVPVPEIELPVLLPHVEQFRPTGTGRSPMASVPAFVDTACPTCDGPAGRETDVSDTFLDSAWYFLRYPSTDIDDAPWDPDRTRRLLPVDLYAGGPEHVIRHHLYARFVVMALHDLGLVPFEEPFPRLRLHGMLTREGAKISKSRGNVVNPDRYIDDVGTDAFRVSLLFSGSWSVGGDFSDQGLSGIERFLRRVWRLVTSPNDPGSGGVDMRTVDRAIASVGHDLERLEFNTAIAFLMELVGWAHAERAAMTASEWNRTVRSIVLLLAPFAPHMAEELWARIGGPYSVHLQPWPEHDPGALIDAEVDLIVQVGGRTRDVVRVALGASRDEALAAAMGSPKVGRHLDGRDVTGVVFVPDRVINLLT